MVNGHEDRMVQSASCDKSLAPHGFCSEGPGGKIA